ncbi:MAG: hypothetical protein ACI9MB_002124 [Verrucomicrobiales bacterium]|jgi:hypothetical protein
MDFDRLLTHLHSFLAWFRQWANAAVRWCGREPQLRVILFLFAFSPALLTGYWISEFAVNVPVWDGWERGVLLRKAHEGTLDFAYLSSPTSITGLWCRGS